MAKQDTTFTVSATAKCRWRVGGQYACCGLNHFSRHHRQQWVSENPNKPIPALNLGKGRGKGRMKGKQIVKRIAVLADGTLVEDYDDEEIDHDNDDPDNGQDGMVSASAGQLALTPGLDTSPGVAAEPTVQALIHSAQALQAPPGMLLAPGLLPVGGVLAQVYAAPPAPYHSDPLIERARAWSEAKFASAETNPAAMGLTRRSIGSLVHSGLDDQPVAPTGLDNQPVALPSVTSDASYSEMETKDIYIYI